ncbi:hypothetical protein ACWCPQ_02740 [Nocardia sp. NPDC001965]
MVEMSGRALLTMCIGSQGMAAAVSSATGPPERWRCCATDRERRNRFAALSPGIC